jgi:hypothetical protein
MTKILNAIGDFLVAVIWEHIWGIIFGVFFATCASLLFKACDVASYISESNASVNTVNESLKENQELIYSAVNIYQNVGFILFIISGVLLLGRTIYKELGKRFPI